MYMTKLDDDSKSYERVTAVHNHNYDKVFSFVLSDTLISSWEVYSTPRMTITPNISLFDMTRGQKAEQMEFPINVFNAWSEKAGMLGEPVLNGTIDLYVEFLNVENQLFSLEAVNSELEINSSTENLSFDMKKEDFFNGTALSMSVECEEVEDCRNTVIFEDRVAKQGGTLGIPHLEITDVEADEYRILV